MANDSKIVVLVADDEPSTLALLSRHLRGKGYAILEASDGDQAWELAHEHLPHLVLLDVMMPGMSGWEVCRKIREAVSLAHTGVIMLTGIGERLNEMTSPLYGADAHVDKPFEFADLDDKIRETLKRRGAGAMGRPDHADEEDGSIAVQPEPLGTKQRTVAKPPVKARPKPAPAKPASKPVAKKPTPKPAPAKKAPAKKAAAKKAPAKKAPAKKAPAKKAPAKKAPAKKAPAKAPAKKAPAKIAVKAKTKAGPKTKQAKAGKSAASAKPSAKKATPAKAAKKTPKKR